MRSDAGVFTPHRFFVLTYNTNLAVVIEGYEDIVLSDTTYFHMLPQRFTQTSVEGITGIRDIISGRIVTLSGAITNPDGDPFFAHFITSVWLWSR